MLTYHPHDFFLPILQGAGIECQCVASRSFPQRVWALRRALRGGRQDVVLAFLEAPSLYAELAAIPTRRWGLVVSERVARPGIQRGLNRCMRMFHGLADYVIANSHTNRLMVERSLPRLAGRVVTIYNAVDLRAFAPAPFPQHGNARRCHIVVAAAYWPQKNPAKFIEGIALARARVPDIDICLDWYGRLPNGKGGTPDTTVFDEAARMVQQHGLQEHVRLNPERSPIQEAYRDADAVAQPSLFEGLPNIVCEAMASGRPVLMSNVCDAGNLVRDGYNGFLFDPLSAEDMATAIVRMAALSAEDREALGRNGRQLAERMFNPATVAARYAQVLTAAAARKRMPMEHWVPDVPESAQRSAESGNFMFRIAKLHLILCKIWQRGLMHFYRPLFASYGKGFRFDPYGCYTFGTIFVGDSVSLGDRPILLAAESKIYIGNKVMFGSEVMILAGDHNTSVVGEFMCNVKVKRPENNRDVIIEDDVWIGSRAIILKGVVIGRGCIVAAGAIVVESAPPYSIVGGVPARVLKFRWDVDTILQHEEKLYPPEKRLSRQALLAFRER